jgi:ParB-like chromosome segregation protein Spo0J
VAGVIFEGQERKVTMELQIVYLPPGELKPYEKNARKHAPDDIEAIKKSILEDGFNDPIATWNGVIVEGHGRQIAAQELGLETVPVIRLDHLTDKQRREYMIRHNRTAELSAWDFQTLEEECAALAIEGQDFEELNFHFADPSALDDLFAPAPEQGKKEAKQIQCPHCGEWFTP